MIRQQSLNRNKTIQGAKSGLWPTCLRWKSKAVRPVPHVVKHVQRNSCTRQGRGFFIYDLRLTISDLPPRSRPRPRQLRPAFKKIILCSWRATICFPRRLKSAGRRRPVEPPKNSPATSRSPRGCARATSTNSPGRPHILAPGQLLRRAIEADRIQSLIFFGPPGTGKTSLAQIIARQTKSKFERLSGVESNVADMRRVLAAAAEPPRKHRPADHSVH